VQRLRVDLSPKREFYDKTKQRPLSVKGGVYWCRWLPCLIFYPSYIVNQCNRNTIYLSCECVLFRKIKKLKLINGFIGVIMSAIPPRIGRFFLDFIKPLLSSVIHATQIYEGQKHLSGCISSDRYERTQHQYSNFLIPTVVQRVF